MPMSMQKITENHRLQADGCGSVFRQFIGLQPLRGVHIFENKTMKIFFFKYHRLLPMVSAKTNALFSLPTKSATTSQNLQ
jgi:hypothetical protein